MATRTVTLARMNRWAILAGYGLLAACTQLLWLTYAPITTQAHRAMGVSVGAAGDLAAIFPLMYVVLALPSGRWLDAQFERALSAGAILTAGGGAFALARLYETEGVYLGDGGLSVEEVRDSWGRIADETGQQAYVNGGEQTAKFFRRMSETA